MSVFGATADDCVRCGECNPSFIVAGQVLGDVDSTRMPPTVIGQLVHELQIASNEDCVVSVELTDKRSLVFPAKARMLRDLDHAKSNVTEHPGYLRR